MAASGALVLTGPILGFRPNCADQQAHVSTSIRLLTPDVALVVRHEGDLAAPTRNGLWVPTTTENENRLIGTVVSVGPGDDDAPCATDLHFGDIVEISRWTGKAYERHGLAGIFGEYGKDAKRYFKNPDGGNERVEMGWEDDFAIMNPAHIIAKIADGRWHFTGGREGREPGLYPVHERVFVELEPEKYEGNIIPVSFDRDAVIPCMKGTVLAVGSAVEEVSAGDRVWVEPEKYTVFNYEEGRQVLSVEEKHIVCRG